MKILIFYFSSSGNTKYIANLIKNGLILTKLEPELIPFNSQKKKTLNFEEIEVLGIGAPIYGLAFTPNMIKWIKNLPILKKKVKFFLFDTNAGIPGTSIKHIRKIMEKKNFEFIGALEIITPTRDSVFELKFLERAKWSRQKIDRAIQFGFRIGLIIRRNEGQLNWSTPTLFGTMFRAFFQVIEK